MLLLHVIAGSVGLFSGFASMLFAKGSRNHQRAGHVYTGAMLIMTAIAVPIAIFISMNPLNVVAASLTFYLVSSAWATVHRRPEQPRGLEHAILGVGLAAGLLGYGIGIHYVGVSNVPAAAFSFVFGSIALLGSWGDLRLLRRREISRTQKLTHHLWRMALSLLIAALSLFLGQAKHLPAWLTSTKMNVIPVLIALGLLIYWPIRVRFAPWTRKPQARLGTADAATGG